MASDDTAPSHVVHTASGRAVRLPITSAYVRSLAAYVDTMVTLFGCDSTLSHAEAWARAHQVAWGRLGRCLRGLRAFCDCEVAARIAGSEVKR